MQSAALPYRLNSKGKVEILLVTSKRSGRWVLPKGNIPRGMLASASAAKESFEEAGVLGTLSDQPITTYRQGKEPCTIISVFALQVTTEVPVWPEMRQRSRRWMSIRQAANVAQSKKLKAVLKSFEQYCQSVR